jgi:hypothetical protein
VIRIARAPGPAISGGVPRARFPPSSTALAVTRCPAQTVGPLCALPQSGTEVSPRKPECPSRSENPILCKDLPSAGPAGQNVPDFVLARDLRESASEDLILNRLRDRHAPIPVSHDKVPIPDEDTAYLDRYTDSYDLGAPFVVIPATSRFNPSKIPPRPPLARPCVLSNSPHVPIRLTQRALASTTLAWSIDPRASGALDRSTGWTSHRASCGFTGHYTRAGADSEQVTFCCANRIGTRSQLP